MYLHLSDASPYNSNPSEDLPKVITGLGAQTYNFFSIEVGVPVQSKNFENVGREYVDEFEIAIQRYYGLSNGPKGYLIEYSFTHSLVGEGTD
jgi:hypothetical protein